MPAKNRLMPWYQLAWIMPVVFYSNFKYISRTFYSEYRTGRDLSCYPLRSIYYSSLLVRHPYQNIKNVNGRHNQTIASTCNVSGRLSENYRRQYVIACYLFHIAKPSASSMQGPLGLMKYERNLFKIGNIFCFEIV